MENMERLFVYGTLAPGKQNHTLLQDIPGHWEPAKVTGILLNEGWGSDLGSPGIVVSEEGHEVEGFLFASNKLSEHWAMLDDYEGSGYRRELVIATTNNDEKVQAYVYALNRKT